jgi:hypothetical protein
LLKVALKHQKSKSNQTVSWFSSFKRLEFQKNISQIWKLLEKLKNSIFFNWLLFIPQVRSLKI